MTLIIILVVAIIILLAFVVLWNDAYYAIFQILATFSGCVAFILGIILIVCSLSLIGVEKDGEIDYQKYLSTKETLEYMLNSDKDVDRVLLSKDIIAFNDEVIKHRINSQRFILKDYYSSKIDWASLELIKLPEQEKAE